MRSLSDGATARVTRHHVVYATCVVGACMGVNAVWVNNWLQREWLAAKWLYRNPSGLTWLALAAAVSTAASAWLMFTWVRGRWVSTSHAPARWIVPVAFAAWVYTWSVESPVLAYDAQLAVAGAVTAWCVSVACLALRPDGPRARGLRVLEIALLELAACAFATEVALRIVRRSIELPLLATGSTSVDAWIAARRLAPGSFHLGFPVNVDGYVDRAPADAARHPRRVACIGDSFSVAVVPHHLHYTTVAEGAFDDLEVYNVGVAHAGPREYLRMLNTTALPLHPDLIVIALFLGNDITEAHRQDATTLSSWLESDEVLIVQLPRRLLALARERRAGAAIAGRGHSADTFGIPTTRAFSPDEIERALPWLADPLTEPPGLSTTRFVYVESTRTDITLPEHQSMYDAIFSYLAQVRKAAGPVPIACVLIPDEYQVEDSLWDELRAGGLSERADRDLPQKLLGAWLDEQQVPYVDLLPVLRTEPPLRDGRRHVYHLRDTHFNARGNRIAGIALAELIERCGVALRTRSKPEQPPR